MFIDSKGHFIQGKEYTLASVWSYGENTIISKDNSYNKFFSAKIQLSEVKHFEYNGSFTWALLSGILKAYFFFGNSVQ